MKQKTFEKGARKDYADIVSHELKTPITAIKGFIETLSDERTSPEDAKKFIAIIKRHSEQLDLIVEDLLMLSKIEQDSDCKEFTQQFETLKYIIEGAVQNIEAKYDHAVTIKFACHESIKASVNAFLIEIAISNLIDNAIKYSGSKEPIDVKCMLWGENVEIIVEDFGNGISAEHLPYIFDRFYRIDKIKSRELGGTGLGLSIVKKIVEAHSGTITVSSKVGKGSKFILKIPKNGNRGDTLIEKIVFVAKRYYQKLIKNFT